MLHVITEFRATVSNQMNQELVPVLKVKFKPSHWKPLTSEFMKNLKATIE